MMNIYSVHMDKAYWSDPDVFRPERHLDAEGKLVKTDHFIPFGTGKKILAENNSLGIQFRYSSRKTNVFGRIPGAQHIFLIQYVAAKKVPFQRDSWPTIAHGGAKLQRHKLLCWFQSND